MPDAKHGDIALWIEKIEDVIELRKEASIMDQGDSQSDNTNINVM